MPRNASGTYTLPSGNPVVSGTLIDATWANNTLADLGNEVTDSLSRSGEGAMLAPLRITDGVQATPSLAFSNEPSSGLYRAGSNEWWAVAAGVQNLRFTNTGLTTRAAAGAVGTPSIAAFNDTDTGIYFPGANELAIATGGAARMTFDSAGAVAVPGTFTLSGGTANGVLYLNGSKVATSGSALVFDGTNLGVGGSPSVKLDVIGGSINTSSFVTITPTTATNNALYRSINTGGTFFSGIDNSAGGVTGTGYAGMLWHTGNYPMVFAVNNSEAMRLTTTGLGIGTASPAAKLDVNGAIYSQTGGVYTDTLTAYSGNNISVNAGSSHFAVTVNASERMRLDSSGNLGLGVTPTSGWGSDRQAIQIGNTVGYFIGNSNTIVGNNTYHDGTNARYINTGQSANNYTQFSSGGHAWYTAPSGTAGSTITFTQALTLDADGRLMVGATSATGGNFFTVERNSTTLPCYANVTGGASETVIANLDPGALITLKNLNTTNNIYTAIRGTSTNGTTNNAILFVRESNSTHAGSIAFGTTNSSSVFAERGRFTAGGFFKASNTGTYANSTNDRYEFSSDKDDINIIVRTTSTGASVVNLYSQFPAGPTAGAYHFAGAIAGSGYQFTVDADGDVKNTNGSYAAISDLKLKQDIEDAASQWDDIKSVRVRKYRFKRTPDAPLQIGVIAQELEQTSPGLVSEDTDRDEENNDLGTTTKSVKYSILYMKAVKALQEAMARIEQLEADMAALKASA